MLAWMPLVAALAQPAPLPRQTENACARAPEALEKQVALEAQRVTSIWYHQQATIPMFVLGPPCKWRCDGGQPSRADNMISFLRYTCFDLDFMLGMNQSDRAYHDATHAMFGGRMMKVPDGLIRASLDFPKVIDFKRELAKLGYKFVEFTSTSVTNDPNGYGRVLVLIEGEEFDQWYQLATMDGLPHYLGRNVDFAVVQKKDERGKRLEVQNFYMNGYSRFAAPKKEWQQEGLGAMHKLNRCMMCHPSGLRGVYPMPGSVHPDEMPVLKHVQKKLDATMANAFGGYYDLSRAGPPMGPVDPPTRPALVARCAAGLSAASRQKVAHAMNCASCHDGKYRGPLVATTDYSTIIHKIMAAPKEGIMPPGEDLSYQERSAVFGCLHLEYSEQLRTWLSGH